MENYYFSTTGKLTKPADSDRDPRRSIYCSLLRNSFCALPLLLLFPVIIGMSFSSCNAIFEKNITEDTLQLILPMNNDTSLVNNIHFKWEKMDGAVFYNLQIVQPSFSAINSFVLDSTIKGEEFYYALAPGTYQFKICGENSAYQSAYTGPYTLYVDSVSDLSSQIVPLLAPADQFYSNAANFTFSWQPVYAAETYEFQLRSGADFMTSGTTLHLAPAIYGTAYAAPTGLFSTEAAYAWGVKAVNSSGASAFSDRTLYIDLTAPNSPLSVSPAHGASFADTVVLKWSTGSDPGIIHAPVSRYVEISTDTLFGTVQQNYTVSVDSVEHVFTSPGTYWWRVYALDAAGNSSTNYSAHRKIIIP
jgi:hypothetical protein